MGYLIGKIFQGIVWTSITVLQGFMAYIDICDAVLTTFIVWISMCTLYDWNGWWAFTLGLAVSLVAYIIFKHSIGFWIISVLYSIAWGVLLTGFICAIFFPNIQEPWCWVWVTVIAVISFRNHYFSRDRKEILAELAAEEAAKAKL